MFNQNQLKMTLKSSFVKFPLVVMAIGLIFLSGCDKEKEPTVTTVEATEITFESAVVGGNVTSDGGAPIIARGVVWGTNQNPSLSDSFTTDEANSTGTFSHKLEGLVDGVSYYARAYATNGVGTTYGNQVTFSTVQKCRVTSLDIVAEEIGYGEFSYSVNFTYDELKRLSNYAVIFDGQADFQVVFKYGANGLIDKAEFWYGGTMEEYLKFTWNANTVSRQWYWNEGSGWEPASWFELVTFNEDGLIEKIDDYVVYKSDPFHVGYTTYQWQNKNVTLIESYYLSDWAKFKAERKKNSIFNPKTTKSYRQKIDINPSAKDFVKDYSAAYTYDNKINPFSFHPALGLTAGETLFVSENNLLTETITIESWEENWTNVYAYQYNTNDYPTELVIADEEYIETWGYNYDCE